MRRILAVLACVVSFATQARIITGAMFMPSPAGVILSIGQWLVFEGEKTYYIEVQGQGKDVDQARLNGFRIATESAVGSIILSDTEVQNSRVTRDEVISYASAYVTKFQIVKEEPSDVGAKVTMKVWLKRSAIANRLLNESKNGGEVDGAQASVSFTTLIEERQTGDRLVGAVLHDYPKRAYDVVVGKARVEFDYNREATLIIPYKLRLNSDYVDSLTTALTATENSGPCMGAVTIIPSGMFSFTKTIKYTDLNKHDLVVSKFLNKTKLQMTLYSESGATLYRDTFQIKGLTPDNLNRYNPSIINLYSRGTNCYRTVTINGSDWVGDNLVILRVNPELLKQATRVEITVI